MKYDAAIKAAFTVVQTSGDERICPCPFHKDGGKPNLYANARSGLYFCHACGAKGHVDKGNNKTDDEQRCLWVQDGIEELRNPRKSKTPTYDDTWLDRFDHRHDFWEARGFSDEIVQAFRLGYDPSTDMLTIPIRTSAGAVVGVVRRRTPEQVQAGLRPKYLYPTGFKMGRMLFAADRIAEAGVTKVALVEGALDAVACWAAGVPAMALFGARLSVDQSKLIKRLGVNTVVCMTDNDGAGDAAVHSVKETLTGTTVLVGWYRDGWPKDPGELTIKQRKLMFDTAVTYAKAWS